MQADPGQGFGPFTNGLLNPDAGIPADIKGQSLRRYGVYRNNVTVGLVRAMEANFPVVRRLLGETYFAGFAREFVQKHPPRSPLIFEYGADFSASLEAADDLRDYPYLTDIARLEQQVRISYHEADATCLAAGDLAAVAEDHLMQSVLVPHPAMALLRSDYAILSIYRANRSEDSGHVENIGDAQSVLVTRPLQSVELNSIDPAQFTFLSAVASGKTFGEAADAAFAVADDFDLTRAISLMLTSGAFQSIQEPL